MNNQAPEYIIKNLIQVRQPEHNLRNENIQLTEKFQEKSENLSISKMLWETIWVNSTNGINI